MLYNYREQFIKNINEVFREERKTKENQMNDIEQNAKKFLGMLEKFIQDSHDEVVAKEAEESKKIKLTYDDIQSEMVKITPLKQLGYDTILCVTRGGLIPAGMIAYQLGINKIVNITASSYNGENIQDADVRITKLSKKDLKVLQNAKKVLIVDDIVDTGNTIDAVYAYLFKKIGLPAADFSTFSIVTKDTDYNDFFIYDLTGDDRWITFPWDV